MTLNKAAISALLLAGLTAYFAAHAYRSVRSGAMTLAGGQPYCIQIPTSEAEFPEYAEYKEAASWKDLTVLAMRGFGARHHAVLVVGPYEGAELFHWSYWENRFNQGTWGKQPIYCHPRRNFLESLPTNSAPDRAHFNVFMGGMYFSIPHEYHPHPLWANGFGFFINASAPSFHPTAHRLPSGAISSKFVGVSFYLSERPRQEFQIPDAVHSVVPLAATDGLERQFVRYIGPERQDVGHTEYFERRPDGRLTRVLTCGASECGHSFEHDGWTYHFDHPLSDLPRWREMEMRFVALIHSFIRCTTESERSADDMPGSGMPVSLRATRCASPGQRSDR